MKVTRELEKQLIKDLKRGSKSNNHKSEKDQMLEYLKEEVLQMFNAEEKVLTTKSRKFEYVVVRSVFVYLARAFQLSSYYNLGQILGGRDHSTIMANEKNAENLFFNYPDIKAKANTIYSQMLTVN